MLAGTDDHLTWLSPVILNLENMGLTHLESEIRVPPEGQVTVVDDGRRPLGGSFFTYLTNQLIL